MSRRRRRLIWFGGLKVSSIATLFVVSLSFRSLFHAMFRIGLP